MDLVGEFQKVEIDGKPFLVYHNVLKPLPHIHTPKSSSKLLASSDDLSVQPLFLCPRIRTLLLLNLLENRKEKDQVLSKFNTSPLFDDTTNDHYVLPLFWCSNKEVDPESDECYACFIQSIGTSFYFCDKCDKRFHKECVELPLEISYPTHPKHSLQLYFSLERSDLCFYCRERATYMVYYCALCNIFMHVLCAQRTIPFFIDQPKRHDHTLTLFPRQASLTCNLCGFINQFLFTYVCPICDFVAHSDCIYIPQTIRISRHHHRVSFISSLPLVKWSCGVCRREIDTDYGAYTCNLCSGYAVHTKCALRRDIWDGIELEGVPEEEEEDVESFERITDGVILHFSHVHHLRFEISGVYDKNKFCQACVLPIYEGGFYVCAECDFILHETCAEAPRRKFHPLHPHPLQLEAVSPATGSFVCKVCNRASNGFVYGCPNKYCNYRIDMRCALASEPFTYQGHLHPLFLALDPKEKPICKVCKLTGDLKVLNCIECDFIICFKCATLPYMAKYKHDEHYFTFCHGDEVSSLDWCELCEGKLAIGGEKGFYKCKENCCTTLHINCLPGVTPYVKCGQTIQLKGDNELHIERNNSCTRPICDNCGRRCLYPTFLVVGEVTFCSFACSSDHS